MFMTILTLVVTPPYMAVPLPSDDITPAVVASEIIGEWHVITSTDSIFDYGLSTGWGYDMYFYEDGTGIEWWFSPYSGWHEVFNFTWESNGNGELILVHTAANFDVIDYYTSPGFAQLVVNILEESLVYTYSVTDNALTIYFRNVYATFNRNFRTVPLITSELVGEWHMTATTALFYAGGLEMGWEYDLYFFGDGTGIEWWFSPDSGWHQIFVFMWFARDGEMTMTYISMNDTVLTYYLGDISGLQGLLFTPTYATYIIEDDTAEIYFYGVFTHTMERN